MLRRVDPRVDEAVRMVDPQAVELVEELADPRADERKRRAGRAQLPGAPIDPGPAPGASPARGATLRGPCTARRAPANPSFVPRSGAPFPGGRDRFGSAARRPARCGPRPRAHTRAPRARAPPVAARQRHRPALPPERAALPRVARGRWS